MTPTDTLKEARFTPGPWIIFRQRARDGLLTIGVEGPFGPKKHIAEMCWAKDVADKETGATGLGDARLIAAAPDLYEALVAYVEHIEPTLTLAIAAGYDNLPHVKLMDAAQAALRKARGEQA